jgi:uncharacterized protein (TIGR02118 family)
LPPFEEVTMRDRRDFIVGAATGFGAVTILSSGMAEAAAAAPVPSFNVLYPAHEGARFDMGYYRATHIPLVEKIMKPVSTLLIEGVAAGGKPAPYAMIAHFRFASTEAMQTALANPAMAELRADLPKFTDIVPTIMMGQSA